MKRNPVYLFNDTSSTGVFEIPLKSIIQILDDGTGNQIMVTIASKTGMNTGTTIGEFLSSPDNYTEVNSGKGISLDQKGAPDGVAPLDTERKIPQKYLKAVDINETFVVNNEMEMLALSPDTGDVAVRTDLGKTFIYNGGLSGTSADWTELRVNSGLVTSVNNTVGDVFLTTDEVPALSGSPFQYYSESAFEISLSASSLSELGDVDALNPPPNSILTYDHINSKWITVSMPTSGNVSSVNSKTGDVILTSLNINEDTNLYFTDSRAQAAVGGLIEDSAILGSDKLWSVDRLNTEFITKVGNDNPDFLGYITINKDSGSRAGLKVVDSFAAGNGIISYLHSDELRFESSFISSTESYIIRPVENATTQQLNIYVRGTIPVSFKKGEAPLTEFTPVEANHLTRKAYVDTEIIGAIANIPEPVLDFLPLDGGRLTGPLMVTDTLPAPGRISVIGENVFTEITNEHFAFFSGDFNNLIPLGMFFDDVNTQLNFKINGSIGMSLQEGLAPVTAFAPTTVDSLTRKDYVDTAITDAIANIPEPDAPDAPIVTSGIGDSYARPGNPIVGFMYYDTDCLKPIWWNGTEWLNALGEAATPPQAIPIAP